MKKLLFAAITIAVISLTGCGSGDASCSDKGRCANNAAPSASAITACQNMLAGACGRQFQSFMNCAESNEKCDSTGSADETTLQAACATQISNLASCWMANPTAGGSDDASCSDKGRCANDTAPSASAITTCQNALVGTCGSQYQSVLNCAKSNETCDSTGSMDVTALEAACATQISDYTSCCTANPTACR